MTKLSKIILFLAVVTTVVSCAGRREESSDSGIATDSTGLADFMAKLAPEGWEIYDQVFQYTAANLYERINGRAELYLAYDVVSLTLATYEDQSDIARFIEISVYDMGNPTNAFGIFSVERYQGEPHLDLGRMSYRSGSNAYIWKGRFYVVVVVSDSAEESQKLGLDLARKVTAALDDSGEEVWGLSILPQDNLVADSVQYFKVDAMGLDFLRDTYTAEYVEGDATYKVFLSRQAGPTEAGDVIEQYAQYSQEYGRGFERTIQDGTEFVRCDMGGVFDIVFQKGRVVGGVLASDNPDDAVEFAAGLWLRLDFE